MQFVFSYVKNIFIFVLIITIILNIFPEKQYIKYIKLFAGVLLIALVFNPVIRINKSRINIPQIIERYSGQRINLDMDMEKELEKIQKKVKERVSESESRYGETESKKNSSH